MSQFQAMAIYYFSGTGNARKVAQWIGEVAEKNSIENKLIDISKIERKNIPAPAAGTLVGFIGPTHGFNFPPVLMYFVFRFPRGKKNSVFLMNTRAGMPLGRRFTLPGLSGCALLLSALILRIKGYKILGMRSIDLPSNWISLHPAVSKRGIELLFRKCEPITKRFIETIIAGKRNLRALYDLPIDLLFTPISFFYFIMGRFIFAKSFYASSACDNCGACIMQCPVKAISTVDNRPFWSYTCESCMHCMNMCPKRAIDTSHGFIIGLLILLSTVVQAVVYNWYIYFNFSILLNESILSKILRMAIEMFIAFISLVISYRVVHYLRRYKAFDILIRYTSLTYYRFWGRYKPKLISKTSEVKK